MRTFQLTKIIRRLAQCEAGETLIATLVALAIISMTGAVFLNGLATSSKATIVADKLSTAESLARTQMEFVRSASYIYGATTYTAASIPDIDDYVSYSVGIAAQALHNPDDGIQKITVTVSRNSNQVLTVTDYKVDR